jgi:N-acetylglucosaminyldiphosphoundecaprenol N-acetyl-beta-D-mannosaminyltransferase
MTSSVLSIRVDAIQRLSAIEQIRGWVVEGSSRYVCAANVHMIMEAIDSAEFRSVVNCADMVTADGMPLVWMLRLKGHENQERVYGPDLMLDLLALSLKEGFRVGFFGSTPSVLDNLIDRLRRKYAGLKIAYAYSPPFRQISPKEDQAIVNEIAGSGAQILFVALGCPKQETWMALHRGNIPAVMIGVGAAFDFHAGIKQQAPRVVQWLGLEWLFRFATEPRRLWRRYLYHNPRFIFLAIADLLGFLQ